MLVYDNRVIYFWGEIFIKCSLNPLMNKEVCANMALFLTNLIIFLRGFSHISYLFNFVFFVLYTQAQIMLGMVQSPQVVCFLVYFYVIFLQPSIARSLHAKKCFLLGSKSSADGSTEQSVSTVSTTA